MNIVGSIRIKYGKNNKERTVYLPKNTYDKILFVFRGKKYFFETSTGKQLNRICIYSELRRQAKKHDLNIHPHTLRHSKAMYLKQTKNLSADQIAKSLGHENVATTLTSYFHGTPSAEEQGIND